MLEALRLMAAAGVSFRCEIYGGGPMREELEQTVSDLGLRGSIALHGARPQVEIADAYARAAVFILAPVVVPDGDRDGIPNVLVEAMAAGVPVVSTRISGIPELIDHGQNGLLVEPGDPVALADAATGVLLDQQMAGRLAKAGRRTVERDFDLALNSRRVAELLGGSSIDATETSMAVVG
jgi:glycosyltransferase involved in cell wall biosynthesis